MAFDWGEVFNRARARGEDHSAAAMIADGAEQRERQGYMRRLWMASQLLEAAANGSDGVDEVMCRKAMEAVRWAHRELSR